MTRFGYESRAEKKLLLDFWLTIGRGTGGSDRPSVRVSAGYPNLARHERAINLKIGLPIALFETPSISASINVDSPAQAVSIDTEAVAEAVRQAIGLDVDIHVASPGQRS
jgi:hypothetical protein